MRSRIATHSHEVRRGDLAAQIRCAGTGGDGPSGGSGHRVDFERERERCDTLVTEALKLGTLAMSAREKAARLEGELSAAWARRRWWRWLGAQTSRPAVRAPSRSPVLVGVPVRI